MGNRMLISKHRVDNNGHGNDDIILVSKSSEKIKYRERSATIGAGGRSISEISLSSETRPGTPLPSGGEEERVALLSKRIKIYRNQIQQLQSELSRVKELLSREVG